MSPDRIRPGSARGLGGEPSPEDVPSRTVGEEPGDAAAEPGAADVAADAPPDAPEVDLPEPAAPEADAPELEPSSPPPGSGTGALAERGAGWAPGAPSVAPRTPPAAKASPTPKTPATPKAPPTPKTPTPKTSPAAPAARVTEDAGTSGDRAVRSPRPRAEVESGVEPGDAAPRFAAAVHRGFFRRLYFGESSLDFVGRRRLWFTMSTIVILAGIISLATRGLNLDIEFVGGTSWTVQSPAVTVSEAKAVLAPFNLSGSTITVLGGTGTSARSLEVQAKIPKGQTSAETHAQLVKVEDALAHLARTSPQQVSIQSVGPSWGGEVTTKAIQALVVFFVLVALYISVFFEWRMALAAIIAVLHDILVTVGIYSLTGFDVTPDTVVAILTILGYSLYDTIVVFDRVRDNLKGVGASGRLTISDVVNLSMNQTLARSINTSLVAIMPIFAVLVLGAEILGATTLQYFGWALLIGLTSGAYSSIFVASPIVAMLKERESRWRRIRERLAARGEHLVLSPAALAAGLLGGEGAGAGLQRSRTARASAARRANEARAATSGPVQPGGAALRDAPDEEPVAAASTRPSGGGQGTRRPGGRPSAGRPSGGPRRKGGRR